MSALIEHYSSANREIESALSVFYFKRLTQGQWTGTTAVASSATTTYPIMSEYHRIARKSYKYVGMTYAGAIECAAAMKTIYTRSVKFQKWNPTAGNMGDWETLQQTSSEMSAEIVPRHVAGDMWEVSISVNEDSVFMSKPDITRDYAVIFATERLRTYDGETET